MTRRNMAKDDSLLLSNLRNYMCLCTGAIVMSALATHQDPATTQQDVLEFGDPRLPQKRRTWAERCRAAKVLLSSMFAIPRGLTVDSGAADHVIPSGWLKCLEILESIGSRMGVTYVAASGTRTPNQGEQRVGFMTREGSWMEIVFQVARVNKPLLSVSKLIDSEMRVVFDKSGSYIYNKVTGDIVRIKRERGVFVLEAFTKDDPAKAKSASNPSGFSRHD